MARCRFWIKFSILPIFSDFLSMKCFKIPISLSKHNLLFRTDARFARIIAKWDFCSILNYCDESNIIVNIHSSSETLEVQLYLCFSYLGCSRLRSLFYFPDIIRKLFCEGLCFVKCHSSSRVRVAEKLGSIHA